MRAPAFSRCQAAGCCNLIAPPGNHRPQLWCSDRCRKTKYSRPCEDCGRPLTGCNGHGPNAPRWCHACMVPHIANTNRVWTRDSTIAAIQDWAREHGEAPAMADWNPWQSRHLLHDETRERRAEEGMAAGRHPSVQVVVNLFGIWNAAIGAAGLEPRAAHGGAGNETRRRRARARAVSDGD